MRRVAVVLSADPSQWSNTPVPCKLTSRRRPPAALFDFLERRRNQPLSEFVPDLCQKIADLDVLADLVRRKNNKLHGINDGRGIDSVPGHHNLSKTYGYFCVTRVPTGVQMESKLGFRSDCCCSSAGTTGTELRGSHHFSL
jgi:hypothetical protein